MQPRPGNPEFQSQHFNRLLLNLNLHLQLLLHLSLFMRLLLFLRLHLHLLLLLLLCLFPLLLLRSLLLLLTWQAVSKRSRKRSVCSSFSKRPKKT